MGEISKLIDGLFEKEADENVFGPTTMIGLPLIAGGIGIPFGEKIYDVFKKVPKKQDDAGYQMPQQNFLKNWELTRYLENDPKTLEIYESLEDPKYDDMTVGDFEQMHRQMVSDIVDSKLQKTASTKAGVATGILSGIGFAGGTWLGYTTKRDADNFNQASKNYVPADKDDVIKEYGMNEYVVNPDAIKENLYNSIHSDTQLDDHVFSPYLNQYDPDDSGMSGLAKDVDNELARRGLDRNSLTVKDYRGILTKVVPKMSWEYDEYYGSPEMHQDIDDFVAEHKTHKKASDIIDELYEKLAADDIAFHASPVQGIEKFRFGEDTSGNNKGKVIFVSHDQSFCSAFGVRWNDTNARLVVETTNQKPPTNANYKGTVLKITDDVDLDKPCSMYTLRGKFKPLRYEDDVEEYTSDPVEIISEEKFSTFKEMAKHYGLEIKDVRPSTIIRGLKDKKTSNFEKGAGEMIDKLYKEAGVVGNFLGKNISKAERELNDASAILSTKKKTLGEQTKSGFLGKTKPMYSEKQIKNMTSEENGAMGIAKDNRERQIKKTFNTRLGVGAASGGSVAYQMQQKKNVQSPDIEPNYNPNYQPDNYMYMSASEVIDSLIEKTAAKLNFSSADNNLGRLKEIATFGAARRANKGLHYIAGTPKAKGINLESDGFKANRGFIDTMKKNYDTEKMQDEKIKSMGSKIKKMNNPDTSRGKFEPHEMYNNPELSSEANKALADAERMSAEMDKIKGFEEKKKSHTHRRVQQDYKALRNYKDNEVAKGLALYGGAALLGKGGYDIATRDKSASELIDSLYKDAGIKDILMAQHNVSAAKKTLKHMTHRNELGLKNRGEFDRHVRFMADAIEQGHHIPTKRMHELANFDLRSQSRVMHAGERMQKATDALDVAKRDRKNEIKNTFSLKKMKEEMI